MVTHDLTGWTPWFFYHSTFLSHSIYMGFHLCHGYLGRWTMYLMHIYIGPQMHCTYLLFGWLYELTGCRLSPRTHIQKGWLERRNKWSEGTENLREKTKLTGCPEIRIPVSTGYKFGLGTPRSKFSSFLSFVLQYFRWTCRVNIFSLSCLSWKENWISWAGITYTLLRL